MDDRGMECVTAEVRSPWGAVTLALALPGRAHLSNPLAAVAVALDRGVPAVDVARAAAAARPVARRGRLTTLANGARLIDDTYNASPAAVAAMLHAMAATPGASRRIAVLGEMLELGEASRVLHHGSGEAAVRAGVDWLVVVGGPAADGLVEGARAAGLAPDRIQRYATAVEAAPAVARLVREGDLVLAKGSRGTRVDLVADALLDDGAGA
jgi:UDP-N-acetylmuramoyl-tripeptide--D-alanyl-D-alanine ligase